MHATERLIGAPLAAALALIGLLNQPLAARAEPEGFPMPDQVFPVAGEADGADAVRLVWKIADGYYLYKSKLRFASKTEGLSLGSPRLPPAQIKHDPAFGDLEIYRGDLDLRIPVDRKPNAGTRLVLEARSQGCADKGFCYPPHRQTLVVDLPEPAQAPAPLRAAAPPVELASADVPGSAGADTARPDVVPPTEQVLRGQRSPTAAARILGGGDEDEIPTADQAFQFQADVTAPNRLQLRWDIAPGTYLYRDKIQLSLNSTDGTKLGVYELPRGDIKKNTILPDGSTGDVEVFHHRIDLTLPLVRGSEAPAEVRLVARYQGCAERGICYPPQTKRLTLNLPAAPAEGATQVLGTDRAAAAQVPQPKPAPEAAPAPLKSAAPSAGDESELAPKPSVTQPSEQDRVAAVLKGGNLWAIVAAFFGFGLLLAFTPCVFPMIPILSGIIAGQGAAITTRKAFVLSLAYVLAMALTYTIAGVLAGLFGANLQAAFQNPWILSLFALVFVALALSMFGFFDLQLPSSLQSRLAELSNKQQGGTLVGVAIMGLLSALIVGPCVAPPLFGALVYISQTGDAVLGGVALFALSLGMGAPLVAIGTSAGKLLPRAGAWMDAVKAVFGVLLLGVAILLLERILPATTAMILWGLLLLCSAVYMGALAQLPPDASGWRKLWKGLGLALGIYGALMLVGAAAGGQDTVQPLRGILPAGPAGAEAARPSFERVKTVADLDRALAAADGRPVMLDFYADWCVSCKEMERYTFSDPKVAAEMGRFLLLQADVTENDEADRALQGRFGIPGPPAILFFDPSGREIQAQRVVGFMPATEFAQKLRDVNP